MSLTLVFAVAAEDPGFRKVVETVSAAYGFGCSFGLAAAQERVKDGLAAVARWRRVSGLAFIHAPNTELPEAPLVDVQLIQGGDKEAALSFFRDMSKELLAASGAFAVMFAVEEWPDNRLVRLRSGRVEDLLARLNRRCSWCDALFNANTGNANCNDDYPLIFEVVS